MTKIKHIANVSFGKDSLAMLLMLIEKGYPLDEVIFFDTGKEFQAIYNLRDKVLPILQKHGIKYTELKPKLPFDYMMFEKPVKKRGTNIIHKYGYSWCGGNCRWGTAQKTNTLNKYIGDNYSYVGIAADETKRIAKARPINQLLPLVGWNMSERDCLNYCYSQGFDWSENGTELYEILDRVSCWCCRNKNLKELKNMYLYLPKYWEKLKNIQYRLPEPLKGVGKSVFELENRFRKECIDYDKRNNKQIRTHY